MRASPQTHKKSRSVWQAVLKIVRHIANERMLARVIRLEADVKHSLAKPKTVDERLDLDHVLVLIFGHLPQELLELAAAFLAYTAFKLG